MGLTRRVKNYPTNEIGAFAHVSGAAEVTVKHNLGVLKHKMRSCRAHIRNDKEDIRQDASTLPASASFLIQQNDNFFIGGAGGAAGAGASGA